MSTGRDPVKGRYRYVSRTVQGTRKEAEAALAALVTQVNAGAGGHTGTNATVAELVEQWLDLKGHPLARRGGAGEDGERAARPRSSGDNAQRLRPLHPGDRPCRGRRDRRPAGTGFSGRRL